jgi:hypothetical protein
MLSSIYDKISLDTMIEDTKKELLTFVLSQFKIMQKVGLEDLEFVDNSGSKSKKVKKNNKITWALVPQIAILSDHYPQLMYSFLSQSDHLIFLEKELLKNKWYLNTESGKIWAKKLKNDFMIFNHIDPEELWEREFNSRLQQYSVELMGSEFQNILELADKGVPNIRFLLPFYDKKVTYKLLSRKIHNCLSSYNIMAFNSLAVSLAHEQLTKMIDKMITLREFFYSINLTTLFDDQDNINILDMMLKDEEDIEKQKKEIFQLGVSDYFLEKRIENKLVFTLGLSIVFEMFNQIERRRKDLSLELFVKEYFKWLIANYKNLSEIDTIGDGRVSKVFVSLKRHLKKLMIANKSKPMDAFQDKEIEMNKNLLKLFYNSFISFGQVTDHEIKLILLSITKFNPQFTESINKCESNTSTKDKILNLCHVENPDSECIIENNFLIRTRCPSGTYLMANSSQCAETCPQGFSQDESNPGICNKPEIKFREVLDVENSIVMKHPSDHENEILSQSGSLKAKIQQLVSREVSQIYKKVSKDFEENKDSKISETERTNVFNHKYKITNCPPQYEEFELFCIPQCPDGWIDQGVSCIKPMNYSIEKYLILQE